MNRSLTLTDPRPCGHVAQRADDRGVPFVFVFVCVLTADHPGPCRYWWREEVAS